MTAAATTAQRRLWLIVAVLALVVAVGGYWLAAGRSQQIDGVWRVTLAHPGGELPFGLEVGEVDGKPAAWLLNPPERLQAERVTRTGNKLVIEFPSYGSRIEATLGWDGKLSGSADLVRRTGPVHLVLGGARGDYRFFPAGPQNGGEVGGRWTVTLQGDKPETGLAQFVQKGNRVTGSIQFPSGDTRFLAGEVSGDRFAVSMFDGNSTSLWRGRLDGNSLTGERFGATSKQPGLWTATRSASAAVEAVEVVKPPVDRIAFSFPDTNGRQVSLTDSQFKSKVVVVSIGGTWCPNCQDEARFLGPYAAAHKAQGLEVLGLNFEYAGDPQRTTAQMASFAARYKLGYPLLLAGEPTPESTKKALPGIGGVKVYPSALFIGRDGRLREIHIGWAGPATGALNAKAQQEFDATVRRLLAEKPTA